MSNKRDMVTTFIIDQQKNLYRFAYSYVRNIDTAMDLVQDMTIKAIHKANGLRDEATVKGWIYRILDNECLMYLRKQKKMEFVEYVDEMNEGKLEDESINNVIDNLPSNLRAIIFLKFQEDMTIKEIATILGENENTIKSRYYKALKLLRIEMEDTDE